MQIVQLTVGTKKSTRSSDQDSNGSDADLNILERQGPPRDWDVERGYTPSRTSAPPEDALNVHSLINIRSDTAEDLVKADKQRYTWYNSAENIELEPTKPQEGRAV
jgi:hypothetical protein